MKIAQKAHFSREIAVRDIVVAVIILSGRAIVARSVGLFLQGRKPKSCCGQVATLSKAVLLNTALNSECLRF